MITEASLLTVATKVVSPAAKALFVKGILALSKEIREKVNKNVVITSNEKKAQDLFVKIYSIRKVKTLWQVDKAVDLSSFYEPPSIKINKTSRKKIQSVDDIGVSGNIVILGIAGQGKSMLMRQLCISELAKGASIPVFIELRKITPEFKLDQLIQSSLEALGLTITPAAYQYLCENSRLCFLFDGFDEIAEKLLNPTLLDIERLSERFPNLRIILSSRPNYGSNGLRQFTNVTICDLEGEEYKAVLSRLLFEEDPELYDEIIKKIDGNRGDIQQFLTTPLMVTLLLIKYRFTKEIPANFTAFYDDILEVLLTRHDALKPGIVRKRKSGLSDHDFRVAFEQLTFRLIGITPSVSEPILYEKTEESLKEAGFSCNADSFLQDLIKITCLLLKDGTSFRFIHKSVPEYYAAAFISKKPEPWVEGFFVKVREQDYFLQIKPIVAFLGEIDPYKKVAFYVRPMLKMLLRNYGNGETAEDVMKRVVGKCELIYETTAHKGWSISHRNSLMTYLIIEGVADKTIFKKIPECLELYIAMDKDSKKKDHLRVTLEELIKCGCCKGMCRGFEELLNESRADLEKADAFVRSSNRAFAGF